MGSHPNSELERQESQLIFSCGEITFLCGAGAGLWTGIKRIRRWTSGKRCGGPCW